MIELFRKRKSFWYPRKVTTLNANFTNDMDVDYFTIQLSGVRLRLSPYLTIDDIHPGGGWSEVHPMMYQYEDAIKICEYLNDSGQFKMKQDWKWFDKMYDIIGGVTNPFYYRPEKHKQSTKI